MKENAYDDQTEEMGQVVWYYTVREYCFVLAYQQRPEVAQQREKAEVVLAEQVRQAEREEVLVRERTSVRILRQEEIVLQADWSGEPLISDWQIGEKRYWLMMRK